MEIITNSTKELAELILRGLASAEDLKKEKLENIIAIKRDSVPHYRIASIDDPKRDEDRERAFRFIASDETVDRSGDIVRVSGWDFRNFKKNPVALWGHDASGLPIGRVFGMEKGIKRDGSPALFESIEYARAEANPSADLIYRLVSDGFIKAVSVGFIPTRSSYPESQEKREAMGLGPFGVLYEKQEQIELSQCSIPANPNALATAAKSLANKGLVSDRAVTALLDAMGIPAKVMVSVGEIAPRLSEPAEEAEEKDIYDNSDERVSDGYKPAPNITLDELRQELSAFKTELLASFSECREEIKTLRKRLAERDSEKPIAPGVPPAVIGQTNSEAEKGCPKSSSDMFTESFLSGLADRYGIGIKREAKL